MAAKDADQLREAFGRPGISPRWTSSSKEGIGTAYSTSSRVWFTISYGILDEIYFPTIDHPQTRDTQFLITDGGSFFHEERRDLVHKTIYPEQNALFYRLTNSDREGRGNVYELVKPRWFEIWKKPEAMRLTGNQLNITDATPAVYWAGADDASEMS